MQQNLNIMNSVFGNSPSVCFDLAAASSPARSVSSMPLPKTTKNKTKSTKKTLTGYILYAAEVRKGICQSNPAASFGEISRIVGNEWKNLPASVKQSWADKANKLNEESAAAVAALVAANALNCSSPAFVNQEYQSIPQEYYEVNFVENVSPQVLLQSPALPETPIVDAVAEANVHSDRKHKEIMQGMGGLSAQLKKNNELMLQQNGLLLKILSALESKNQK